MPPLWGIRRQFLQLRNRITTGSTNSAGHATYPLKPHNKFEVMDPDLLLLFPVRERGIQAKPSHQAPTTTPVSTSQVKNPYNLPVWSSPINLEEKVVKKEDPLMFSRQDLSHHKPFVPPQASQMNPRQLSLPQSNPHSTRGLSSLSAFSPSPAPLPAPAPTSTPTLFKSEERNVQTNVQSSQPILLLPSGTPTVLLPISSSPTPIITSAYNNTGSEESSPITFTAIFLPLLLSSLACCLMIQRGRMGGGKSRELEWLMKGDGGGISSNDSSGSGVYGTTSRELNEGDTGDGGMFLGLGGLGLGVRDFIVGLVSSKSVNNLSMITSNESQEKSIKTSLVSSDTVTEDTSSSSKNGLFIPPTSRDLYRSHNRSLLCGKLSFSQLDDDDDDDVSTSSSQSPETPLAWSPISPFKSSLVLGKDLMKQLLGKTSLLVGGKEQNGEQDELDHSNEASFSDNEKAETAVSASTKQRTENNATARSIDVSSNDERDREQNILDVVKASKTNDKEIISPVKTTTVETRTKGAILEEKISHKSSAKVNVSLGTSTEETNGEKSVSKVGSTSFTVQEETNAKEFVSTRRSKSIGVRNKTSRKKKASDQKTNTTIDENSNAQKSVSERIIATSVVVDESDSITVDMAADGNASVSTLDTKTDASTETEATKEKFLQVRPYKETKPDEDTKSKSEDTKSEANEDTKSKSNLMVNTSNDTSTLMRDASTLTSPSLTNSISTTKAVRQFSLTPKQPKRARAVRALLAGSSQVDGAGKGKSGVPDMRDRDKEDDGIDKYFVVIDSMPEEQKPLPERKNLAQLIRSTSDNNILLERLLCESIVLNCSSPYKSAEDEVMEQALLSMTELLGVSKPLANKLRNHFKEESCPHLDWGVHEVIPFSASFRQLTSEHQLNNVSRIVRTSRPTGYRMYTRSLHEPRLLLASCDWYVKAVDPKTGGMDIGAMTTVQRRKCETFIDQKEELGLHVIGISFKNYKREPRGGWGRHVKLDHGMIFLGLIGIQWE